MKKFFSILSLTIILAACASVSSKDSSSVDTKNLPRVAIDAQGIDVGLSDDVDVSRRCFKDADCVVFGENGDCNCGCYNQDFLPKKSEEKCFCLAPASCRCRNSMCDGVFQ